MAQNNLVGTGGSIAAGGGGGVSGSGAANQVTYWTAATTIAGSSNFTFDGSNSTLNGNLTVGSTTLDFASQLRVIGSAAAASTNIFAFKLNGGAHTNMNAGTENTDVLFDLARTVQFATGASTNERAFKILAPTYSFVGASTLTSAVTLYVNGAPLAGTNATITYAAAIAVDSWSSGAANTFGIISNLANIPTLTGATTNLFGIYASSKNGTVTLGDQTALTRTVALVYIDSPQYTSTTNVRTVTTAASLYIAGVQNPTTNVTFTNNYAIYVGNSPASKGSPNIIKVDAGAHTTLAAATEASDVVFNLARTVQFATGDWSVFQNAFKVLAPTYSMVAATNMVAASTLYIGGGPLAGTNNTLQNSVGLFLDTWLTSATQSGVGLLCVPPGIANGVGSIGKVCGLNIGPVGGNISLGNQAATLTQLFGVEIDQVTYQSTGSVRTVTNPASLYVSGPAINGGNVTFTNGPYVAWFAQNSPGDPVRVDGSLLLGTGNKSSNPLNGQLIIQQGAASSGGAVMLNATGGAHLALTASGEASDVTFNLARTVQFSTGALTTQRAFLITAPTYSFIGASTITNASTFYVGGAPSTGSNATITNAIGFLSDSWQATGTNNFNTLASSPGIATGVGNVTQLIGIFVTGVSGGTSLGNTTSTLTTLAHIYIDSTTFTSTTNTRTVTTAASLYIAGVQNPTTNVTITNNYALYIGSQAITKGSPTIVKIDGGAHTTLTASTEASDLNFNLARTVQFATGALTTQRAIQISAPTYGFVGASTLTTAIGLDLGGAPLAGTNATITNAYGTQIGAATTQVSGASLLYAALRLAAHTLTVTGTTSVTSAGPAAVSIGQMTVTDASACTLTNASSLYIAAAPAQAGSATITNKYSIWVAAGLTRLDGGVMVGGDNGSGLASTTSFTNATNSTVTNAYTVKGGQAATTANTGWTKIYIGTTVAWIPYWANATP